MGEKGPETGKQIDKKISTTPKAKEKTITTPEKREINAGNIYAYKDTLNTILQVDKDNWKIFMKNKIMRKMQDKVTGYWLEDGSIRNDLTWSMNPEEDEQSFDQNNPTKERDSGIKWYLSPTNSFIFKYMNTLIKIQYKDGLNKEIKYIPLTPQQEKDFLQKIAEKKKLNEATSYLQQNLNTRDNQTA